MKKNLLKFASIISLTVFYPLIAFAAVGQCDTLNGIGKIICQIHQLLNSIVPVLIALGLVYFVWGVVQYVIAGGEEAKKKGKEVMIYGIIGFAVILSIWGLVNIVVTTFDIGGVVALELETGVTLGSCSMGTNLGGFLNYITCLINSSVIPLIFALATATFVWGVVQFFLLNAGEESKRQQGKQFMLWGIIALAVMLSVWGLVGILKATFGITGSFLPQVTPPNSTNQSGQQPDTCLPDCLGNGGSSSFCNDLCGATEL